MVKVVIFGVIAFLYFVGSSFTSRDSKRRWIRNAWLICFIAASVLRIIGLLEAYKTQPNTLTMSHVKVWQNMELTTRDFTGSYSASVLLKESNPGKLLGRVTITTESDRACGLSLHCSGNNIVFDRVLDGMMLRTISFEIGKPPLELCIRADNPAVVTITGSHNIGKHTLKFNDSLPSQLHPKYL